jgi:hypothetical protein
MQVSLCTLPASCAACGLVVPRGEFAVVDGGLTHLRCAAQRSPDGVRRALMAYRQEIPGLASILKDTGTLGPLPEPYLMRADLPTTRSAAEKLWALAVPLRGTPDALMAQLHEPLPAPSGWSERMAAWRPYAEEKTLRGAVIVLRSMNPYRDHTVGLSYGERKLWDEAIATVVAAHALSEKELFRRLDSAHDALFVERSLSKATTPLDEGLAAALSRAAWIGNLTSAPGPANGTRCGGQPWTNPDAPTPMLGGRPMPLLIQVDLAQFGARQRPGLLQVFYDQDAAHAYSGNTPYDVLDDWAPWVVSKHVRIIDPEVGKLGDWESSRAWPGFSFTSWEHIVELPGRETLGEIGLAWGNANDAGEPARGFKVGGWPAWHQGPDYPACPRTRLPCEYVLQIPSCWELGTDFAGGQGSAWVFESVLGELTMLYQR